MPLCSILRLALTLLVACSVFAGLARAELPRLKVSENKRFLVTSDGKPFFYLGDTGWELFHRLSREDGRDYLGIRARQRFNVIQAVAIAEFAGHNVPNVYGHLPLTDFDPARPAVKDGPQNDYWDHVDFLVEEANRQGMYVGFLPTWGSYWHDPVHNNKPLFDVKNAEIYGEWLGKRYKDKGLIWILGGDRSVDNDAQGEIIRAMARGLRRGDGGTHLMTFHPNGGKGSAQWWHTEVWLDFNMRQNGHNADFPGRYDQTKVDYDRTPVKPVLDAEPIYEGHPIAFNAKNFGHSVAADVRRALYWDLFQGACGHTYGHHTIWQFWTRERKPVNDPLLEWRQAVEDPGAPQMVFGKRLIESRPQLSRIPDNELIVTDRVATAVPGSGRARFVATRDKEGTYAFVYVPVGRPFRVNLKALSGEKIKAWWFNPRNGQAREVESFLRSGSNGEREFISPDSGELLDWILVLDDASKNYSPPGQEK